MIKQTTLTLFTASLIALAACGGGDGPAAPPPEPPRTPSKVGILEGSGQDTIAGAPVTIRPAVIVTDAKNVPFAGVPVTFSVTRGGGTATGATVSTGADGVARVGSWVLGDDTRPGQQTLTANVANLPPVTFTATARPVRPASIAKVSADSQFVAIAALIPLTVAVRDAFQNLVPGAPVRFNASCGRFFTGTGSDYTNDFRTTTNASGQATGQFVINGAGTTQCTFNVTVPETSIATQFTVFRRF